MNIETKRKPYIAYLKLLAIAKRAEKKSSELIINKNTKTSLITALSIISIL